MSYRYQNTYAYFVRGDRHAAMCRTSIESVRKAHAKADSKSVGFVVVTDEPSQTWQHWKLDADIVQIPSGMPIMLANLEAQCTVLATHPHGQAVTFLDTDILALAPLPETPGADMTITWRDHAVVSEDGEKIEAVARRMPYNYGVIRAVAGYASLEAFIWMRERIRRMHPDYQNWYGNQLALFDLAGRRPDSEEVRVDTRPIPWLLTNHGNGVRIAKLPGIRHNYTPRKVGEALWRDGEPVRTMLHFKGGARPLMQSYAEKLDVGWYVEPQEKAA